ncbi:type II toxin-antitoxin system VapC family toxin [Candidatus Nitrospira inopinata]|uniref:Putative PilT protein domain protein n=1 Tax=Candidatus Nitrospira inopinata TaxID=1715989 RepID=A0A0S4KSQ1_9BACT|nr:type II toxin-antitoxin system VapC family toxin [Candidatus Nitrospira inopinata]CUQ65380.1 putative PilT protein domain protein [Candidatus Nitrospira inopinata]
MSFVLDNSVTMRWFFGDGNPQDLAYAGRVLDAMQETKAVVPMTWGLEVANVIAKAEAKALVTEARSKTFLEMLEEVEIEVDAATFARALSDTLHLARRYKLSAYDASYLELALRAGLPLATLDEALQKAAKKAGVKKFA